MTRDLMDVLAELAGEGRVPVDDRSHRDRPLWPHVGGVEFLLGVSVYAYEGGRVDIVSWREHGSIGLVGWGGLRHLTDEDGRSSTERGVGDR